MFGFTKKLITTITLALTVVMLFAAPASAEETPRGIVEEAETLPLEDPAPFINPGIIDLGPIFFPAETEEPEAPVSVGDIDPAIRDAVVDVNRADLLDETIVIPENQQSEIPQIDLDYLDRNDGPQIDITPGSVFDPSDFNPTIPLVPATPATPAPVPAPADPAPATPADPAPATPAPATPAPADPAPATPAPATPAPATPAPATPAPSATPAPAATATPAAPERTTTPAATPAPTPTATSAGTPAGASTSGDTAIADGAPVATATTPSPIDPSVFDGRNLGEIDFAGPTPASSSNALDGSDDIRTTEVVAGSDDLADEDIADDEIAELDKAANDKSLDSDADSDSESAADDATTQGSDADESADNVDDLAGATVPSNDGSGFPFVKIAAGGFGLMLLLAIATGLVLANGRRTQGAM